MKEDNCKHQRNNPMVFQLNNISQKHTNAITYNADDGGQAMGKELRHVQISRCIMHKAHR